MARTLSETTGYSHLEERADLLAAAFIATFGDVGINAVSALWPRMDRISYAALISALSRVPDRPTVDSRRDLFTALSRSRDSVISEAAVDALDSLEAISELESAPDVA